MNDADSPATKRDLKDMERDLKQFILDREIVAMRWVISIQIAYFFGTLAAVWFMTNQFFNQILSHLPK